MGNFFINPGAIPSLEDLIEANRQKIAEGNEQMASDPGRPRGLVGYTGGEGATTMPEQRAAVAKAQAERRSRRRRT